MTAFGIDTTDYSQLTADTLKLLLKTRQAAVETDIVAERRRHRRVMTELNARLNQDCGEIAKELRRRESLEEKARTTLSRTRYRRLESSHAE